MLLLATLFMFTACGDDELDNIKLSKTTYTMNHKESQKIEGTNVADIVWNSDNEFVATVKDNTITGQYVGKTTVKSATKNLVFSVEVKPRYNTYKEPYLDWNASKATIKAKYGTPESENENSLIYLTSNTNAPMIMYIFENGKLSICGVLCNTSVATQLGNFLVERYVPVEVDEENNSVTFMHCYGKISDPQIDYGVGMQYNSSIGGILIAYVCINDSRSRSSDDIDFSMAFQKLESMLK